MLGSSGTQVLNALLLTLRTADEGTFCALFSDWPWASGGVREAPEDGWDTPRELFRKLRGLRGDGSLRVLDTYGSEVEMGVRLANTPSDGGPCRGDLLLVLRVAPSGALERCAAFGEGAVWDPQAASAEAVPPDICTMVQAYFQSWNTGDEAAHFGLMDPDIRYFGSISGLDFEGVSAVRGVQRAARGSIGVARLEPLRIFGRGPAFAVLTRLHPGDAARAAAEGVWTFALGADGRIVRMSILWNPLQLLG